MKNKLATLFSILALAAVIGVMSWNDMHRKADTDSKEASIVGGYYVDNDAAAAVIPDDSLPVTIYQGEFKYSTKGKPSFTGNGMTTQTFAQRQINFLIRFSSIPKDPADTFAKIKLLLEKWENQGSIVSGIFLDYRPRNPDFRAYSAFIDAFRKHFAANPYLLMPVADISWLDDSQKSNMRLLQDKVSLFLIEIRKPGLTPETLLKLKNSRYRFQLKLPPGMATTGAGLKPLDEAAMFAGGILALDANKPLPKKEQKISILPKL